ncbi:MAG: peptide deformylase, partial [Bdellovibrionales bacterium]|nr:peptide deformylase [Bdellovibrionales bacterium]NQZ19845.1 peptide deformylase [Bdellovibrionales bacterium]
MALLDVLKFPDPRLRLKGKSLDEVTPELKQLASDMLETMYDDHGVGLAANQVGVLQRVIGMDL